MVRGCIVTLLAIGGCRSPASSDDDAHGASSSSTTTSTAPTDETGGDASSSSGAIADGPPQILDIGGTAVSLAEDERTTLTAFVHHPRGDEAVVEGALVDATGGGSYGAFVRGVGGRWSIDVGWADIAAHQDLYFEGEIVIELVARFVDDAGLVAEASYGLPLRCIPLAPYSCDGTCTDLDDSNNHCGACGRVCEEQWGLGVFTGGCVAGACAPVWSSCLDLREHLTCDAACVAQGSYCVPGGCEGHTVMPIHETWECDEPGWPFAWAEPDGCEAVPLTPQVRCCCAQ